jgi:anti-sigma B factor antagonist
LEQPDESVRQRATEENDFLNASFRATAEPSDGLHTVSIFGELDQGTAPELRSVLGETLGTPTVAVLVDLSDCAFIDSTGLSLLVEAKRRLTEERRPFGVCCPEADVRRLLELTGIDEAVALYDTRDEAEAALRNGAPS